MYKTFQSFQIHLNRLRKPFQLLIFKWAVHNHIHFMFTQGLTYLNVKIRIPREFLVGRVEVNWRNTDLYIKGGFTDK